MTGRRLARLVVAAAAMVAMVAPSTAGSSAAQERGSAGPGLLFGLGPTADTALDSPLTQRAPIGMLTTWFNGSSDLEWLRYWEDTLIPQAYAAGHDLHLIVYNAGASGVTETEHGPACGLTYPLSDAMIRDMQELARIFSGSGTLYVTMFTEFQTYPCEHNQWVGSENYYRALQDRYLEAAEVFRSANPRAKVGLGWGGWQARWDAPQVGGGRSLIGHFADVLEQSDYQAFQAMEVDTNLEVMQTMTRLLGRYGPVMVAHYLPDDESRSVYDRDLAQVFTDEVVAGLVRDGLFAFSFMDPLLLDDPARLQRTVDVVRRHSVGTPAVEPAPAPSPPADTSPRSGCSHAR